VFFRFRAHTRRACARAKWRILCEASHATCEASRVGRPDANSRTEPGGLCESSRGSRAILRTVGRYAGRSFAKGIFARVFPAVLRSGKLPSPREYEASPGRCEASPPGRRWKSMKSRSVHLPHRSNLPPVELCSDARVPARADMDVHGPRVRRHSSITRARNRCDSMQTIDACLRGAEGAKFRSGCTKLPTEPRAGGSRLELICN